MVKYECLPEFIKGINKFGRTPLKVPLKKLIRKIILDPYIGKPMQYDREGSREVYINSFRISYSYNLKGNIITFLSIYHKDEQ